MSHVNATLTNISADKCKRAAICRNKECNIVPEKVLNDRQEYDKEIKFEVASQIINAVCSGAIVRRRLALRKKEVRTKLQQASKILAVNQKFSNIDKTRYRRYKNAPFQDENARRNLWMFDTPESGPLCLMCCQIVTYSLLSGCELAEIAEEAGFEVGEPCPHALFPSSPLSSFLQFLLQ